MDAPPAPRCTIRSLAVRAVDVPLEPPLQTAAGAIRSAPLVLVDLLTEQGVTGSAYLFAYTPSALAPAAAMVAGLEPLVRGQALAPLALSRMLAARFRLLGTQGLVGMALAVLDMAAWDAHARALGLPLARLLGAAGTERTPAYASLRGWTAAELAEEAGQAVARGFRAVKLKFGHPTLDTELDVLRAVRGAVGDGVAVMVDANQAFTVPEAIRRAAAYDDAGLVWLEEPVAAGDLAGHAAVARAARTPVQRGENDWGPQDLARSLAAGAGDLVMPDANKIGGVTGWMAAVALAEAAGVPVSSHVFIEFSSHLLAATPGRHWMEWLDFAGPVLAGGTPELRDGGVAPLDTPGTGLVWDEEAIRRYQA